MIQKETSLVLAAFALLPLAGGPARAADPAPLELVQKIALHGPADKRLDHLALDAKGNRLFVANMANASFDVIDLNAGKLLKSVPDQRGVQGVAHAPDVGRVFVGVGDDGVCNVFDDKEYKLEKGIKLADADNVRYDARTKRVYVAHAEKSLAVIDPKTLEVKAEVKLPGQPEAFQLEAGRPRLYLNVPSQKAVVVIDTEKNEVVKTYPLKSAERNYPLALDEEGHRLFVGCRKPAAVVILDTESGRELGSGVNELLDEPGASYPVNLHSLTSNPLHGCASFADT